MQKSEFKILPLVEQFAIVNELNVFTCSTEYADSLARADKINASDRADGYFDNRVTRNEEINCAFVEGVVLSKISYKTVAGIAKNSRFFSPKKFVVTADYLPTLYEVSLKTNKIGNEALTTMLANRLAGTYKDKNKDGSTWNKGGIDSLTEEKVAEVLANVVNAPKFEKVS